MRYSKQSSSRNLKSIDNNINDSKIYTKAKNKENISVKKL